MADKGTPGSQAPEPGQGAATPRRPGRGRKVLLIGSLALNLIFIGLIVGAVLRGGPPGSGPRHLDRMSMGLGAYIEALPPDVRAGVKAAGGGFDLADRRARFQAVREGRRAMTAALKADPFDADALRAAVAGHRNAALGGSVALQDAFVEAFAALSPEQRAEVLEKARSLKRAWREKRKQRREDK